MKTKYNRKRAKHKGIRRETAAATNRRLRAHIMRKVGALLRTARVNTGMSPSQLARAFQCKTARVHAIETGHDSRVLYPLFLMRYARSLGYTLTFTAVPRGQRIPGTKRLMLVLGED